MENSKGKFRLSFMRSKCLLTYSIIHSSELNKKGYIEMYLMAYKKHWEG